MSEAGRIAIVAHSHPRLHAGGGEVAAWRQFDALRAAGDDVYFLGTVTDGSRLGRAPGEVAAFDDRDLALVAPPMDGFGMEHPNPVTEGQILDLLLRLGADTYHFHHIWNVGAGTIRRLRAARPQARLLLTLHEMASVCALHGQMVKAGGALCTGWGPEDCAACLPGRVPLSMVLRRRRLLEVLALMDLLIAPSRFVAARHEDWGIPPGRIRLIENGFPDAALPPPAPCPMPEEAADLSRRFAFFGNATPTKGLDVLIAAAALTTWVTFAPCFAWIFLGAPWIERLRANRALSSALAAVTAAVVGVILNLGLWFAWHFVLPDGHIDPWAAALTALALALTFAARLGMVPVLAICAGLGVGLRLAGAV